MWHCHVDIAYPWLSDSIRLQWALRMKRASPISAVRGSDALFPNDLGRTCSVFGCNSDEVTAVYLVNLYYIYFMQAFNSEFIKYYKVFDV